MRTRASVGGSREGVCCYSVPVGCAVFGVCVKPALVGCSCSWFKCRPVCSLEHADHACARSTATVCIQTPQTPCSVSRVDVQAARASFVVSEDSVGGVADQVHIGMKPWRVEKKGGEGWWSPNEEILQEMRKRVSTVTWSRAVEWLQRGAVGTLLILEDVSHDSVQMRAVRGNERGGCAAGEIVDLNILPGVAGDAAGKGLLRLGRWVGDESPDLPLTSSFAAYLEFLYKVTIRRGMYGKGRLLER
jgi:hypothetical protein